MVGWDEGRQGMIKYKKKKLKKGMGSSLINGERGVEKSRKSAFNSKINVHDSKMY